MKTTFKFLPASLIALAIFAQACNSNQNHSVADSTQSAQKATLDSIAGDTVNNMNNGSKPDQFMEQASVGGMVEVAMGKIGEQKGSQQNIRDFSAMIVKDHTAANAQLSTLASAKSFKMPTAIPAMKKDHLKDLDKYTGKDFDSYYINMMVEDHLTDISLFEGATKSADTAVRSFALKILPVLKKHYQQAHQLSLQFAKRKDNM